MGPKKEFADAVEVLKFAREAGLYPELMAQLQKDFERANIPFKFIPAKEHPKSEIIQFSEWVNEKIYRLLLEDFQGYLNLMYAIDIPEREFKGVTALDVVEVAPQISLLVLRRELKKVWIRRNYDS